MSELARRVAFAVIAAPLAIGLIYLGGPFLAALLGIVAALGAWEFCRIARAGGIPTLDMVAIPLAALVPLLVHAHYLQLWTPSLGILALVAPAMLGVAIWARGVAGKPLAAVAATLFAVAYVGVLGFGYALRYAPYASGRNPEGPHAVDPAAGTAILLLPVILTWASDIGAYFVGRAIGRHKLIPAVSPGKTVEGAIGGLVLSVVVSWLYVRFVLEPVALLGMRPAAIVLFGVVVSAAAQLGDLAESLLKREAGVKDSSRLLPGHGGILDRFDSLFFVLPVAWVLLTQAHLLLPVPR